MHTTPNNLVINLFIYCTKPFLRDLRIGNAIITRTFRFRKKNYAGNSRNSGSLMMPKAVESIALDTCLTG